MATESISKQCTNCKQIKPISEFTQCRSSKDGFKSRCKICISKFNKEYNKTEKGKAAHKRYAQSEKGKVSQRARHKRSKVHHPNQVKAQNAVNNAITSGKMHRPDSQLCHYCPKPAQQYHHWHGYEPEHWLDVVPACKDCHTKNH